MTVRLLTDYPPYKAGNLFTSDANTEAGLVAQHMADTNLTGGTAYTPPVPQRGTARARTAAQLAAAPTVLDLSTDGEFYLNTDPTQRYVINAAGTAYATFGGGGGGAVSSVAGKTGAVTLATSDLTDGVALNTQVSNNTTAIAAKVATASVGAANGVAALDGSGKVPVAQLPAAVQGALNYQGVWNASTNNPTLTSSAGTKGFYYTVGTAGTTSLDGIAQWNVGDHASFNGTVWEKIDGVASEVLTVGGQAPGVGGNVVLALANLSDGAAQQVVISGAIQSSQRGVASGVATLDGAVHLPAAQLPALTGDVTTTAGSAATALAATAPALSQQSTNAQSGTAYTLVLADAGQNVDMNNAAANVLTIPPNSAVAFPINTLITVTRVGVGSTTIAPGAGVTINKPSARTLAISAQLETAQLYKVGTDTWRALVG